MESNWAAEHLQTIRTLMERAAVYRRALAPIMICNGVLGAVGAVAGGFLRIDSARGFTLYWAGIGAFALAGSFLLVRRQALKESEPFWSPPTRRIAQALLPPVFVGMAAGSLAAFWPGCDFIQPWGLPALWMLLYGCALNAAGFFMARGIKLFGWLFVLCGCGLIAVCCWAGGPLAPIQCHRVMGAVFGGLHLAYGIYLYFTEPRRNEM
jgi:hypothetical protein